MPEHDCLPSNVSAAEFLTHMAEVSRVAAGDGADPCGGYPAPHRALRGAVPVHGRLLDRHEAAGQAGAGARARPGRRLPGRADRRARSAGSGGDAGAGAQDAPGVRDQRADLVAPDGRRRADLRPDPRAAGGPAGAVGRGGAVHPGDGDRVHRGGRQPGAPGGGAGAAGRRGELGRRRADDLGLGRVGLRPRARRAGRGRGAAAPDGAPRRALAELFRRDGEDPEWRSR